MAKSRAANNMGTIRQRKDGRWEARYTAPDGKQKSIYGKDQKEVAKALRAATHEVDNGHWLETSKMTVSEWLDIWLKEYQGHNSDRTILKYKCIVDKHFKPMLGNVKVTKLLPLHARRTVNDLQRQGLAPVTIRNYVRIFAASMECAIEAGIVKDNPFDGVKLPRSQPTKLNIIDREIIPDFIKAAKNTDYPNELIFMLLTGLRVGEARGVKWSDIDFAKGTLHVQRQLHPVSKHTKRVTAPKYGEDRTLYLPEEVIALLKDQRRKQAEQRLASGNWVDDEISTDLVFRTKDGNPHNDRTIYNAVKAVGKEIGLEELHPHDLRHSYAVAALRSGTDVKTVQYNLGHKTSQMTLDVYACYTDDAGKQGALKLSQYLKDMV